MKKPNVLFVFSDQHRAQAMMHAGDPNVRTPVMDQIAMEGARFTHAVSTVPVCTPARATLLTGQYPLKHGLFVNDVPLRNDVTTIGDSFKASGYATAYIGKWHIDGLGREVYIPPERRRGFDFWRVLECTHDYHNSFFYGDDEQLQKWNGYDASAQTDCAVEYIKNRQPDKPFALFLSWGPPHDPYQTAPEKYRCQYNPDHLRLRPNVPEGLEDAARKSLAGYYGHVSALDDCLGKILDVLRKEKLEDDTIFIYTSDHGDMLCSQGEYTKQKPWDESILVPFLVRWPGVIQAGSVVHTPIGTEDIMPTLLGLCGLDIPSSVQGESLAATLKGHGGKPEDRAALIASIMPIGTWSKKKGGREYRGVRTERYTFVCDLNGPWLLYDNVMDPYQTMNVCGQKKYNDIQLHLAGALQNKLNKYGDEFLPGETYVKRWGYDLSA